MCLLKPLLLAFGAWACLACTPAQPPSPPPVAVPETPYARVFGDQQAAVASVNPIATQAGIDALQKGGNAIDAALAVAFSLGVVDSHNSGIGGGCFILARLANGEILALDGREMAPSAAQRDMFILNGEYRPELSRTGALASGVPGSVAALYELQRRGGNLDFEQVVLPAAYLAELGFKIDRTLAQRLASTAQNLARFPASARIFLDQNGDPWPEGHRLRQSDLAMSYRKLARQGPDWFYRGEFAQRTHDWMASHSGLITKEDFANYQLVLRKPVVTQFEGYTVYGFPPPSSGGVHIAQMLNMVALYDWQALAEADRYHLLAEVMQRAFADRAYWLGDADFTPVPRSLVSPEYAAQRAQSIRFDQASSEVVKGTPPAADEDLFGKHTTHIATADKAGNWVAITTTLNTSFGSKVVIPGTGVLMNNQMDDFAAQPGVPNAYGLVGAEANSIAPGKRPLSSMSPTLVMQAGEPIMTLGAAGGPTIITQVLQTLVRALVLDQPTDEAVAGLRVHQQWRPPLLFVEQDTPELLRQELSARGHQLKEMGSFGGTQAIRLRDGRFEAVTEPRVIERNRGE